ncbi:MAG: hypothetical protein PHE43_04140 [Candidatus Nanoarchaeia archaeon]|nr:hypothetical protein [Candidatus Nanoarchaeia archaeon]
MKKVLFAFLICFVLCSFAFSQNLSEQQKYTLREMQDYFKGLRFFPEYNATAKNIYLQLVEHSGMQFPVFYAQTFQWGQANYGGVIVIDISILSKGKDILAFVLAHEWGHQALGHGPNIYHQGTVWSYSKWPRIKEEEADEYAAEFLCDYGYDIEKVCNFLRSNPFSDPMHGSGSERAASVKKTAVGCDNSETNDSPKICSKCKGTGFVLVNETCSCCRGNGYLICARCMGNGGWWYYGQWVTCNSCFGRGTLICGCCRGAGGRQVRIVCDRCDGIGEED